MIRIINLILLINGVLFSKLFVLVFFKKLCLGMVVIINKIIVIMKLIFVYFKVCVFLLVICEDVFLWLLCIKLLLYFFNLGIMSLVVISNIVGSNIMIFVVIKY